jgi:hypothetical protein
MIRVGTLGGVVSAPYDRIAPARGSKYRRG